MKKLLALTLAICICLLSVLSVFAASNSVYRTGDVNLSGDIDVLDATHIQLHLANKTTLTQTQLDLCDVSADDTISIIDATYIQMYVAQIIDELPSDKENGIKAVASKINALQTDSTLTISLLADMHYNEEEAFTRFKDKNIENLKDIQSLTNIDMIANLGDFVVGNVEKEKTLKSLNILFDKTSDMALCPILNVRGNHDDNGWYSYGGYGGSYKADEIINDEEYAQLLKTTLPQNFVTDASNPDGGYGYIDHEKSKIRVFMLNSCDIPYILEEDNTYRYSSYTGHAFSDAQLDFVADSLLFSDKENSSEWAALFLSHVPLDSSNQDNERFGNNNALIRGHEYMLSIINAYRKGTSFEKSGSVYISSHPNDRKEDFMVDVSADYSQKGCGEVIAFLSGHTHSDNYSNQVGLENSLSYGYTFIGTSGSEGFANLVINRDNKTISVVKHGAIHEEKTNGVIVTPPENGSISSGEWSVTYSQFLPNGENLSNGMSITNPLYYSFDNTLTTGIDLETLEVIGSAQFKSARQITKAVMVKPLTTYILPSDFSGECLTFNQAGSKRSYLKVETGDSFKYITTGDRTAYVSFSIDTGLYRDYENFYIKELYNPLYKQQ